MAGCWLVTLLVGSRGRIGLATPTPNGHLPALFGGLFHVQLGEWGFCPLDRAVGVNPEFYLRYGACPTSTKRLCMKHIQYKKLRLFIRKARSARDKLNAKCAIDPPSAPPTSWPGKSINSGQWPSHLGCGYEKPLGTWLHYILHQRMRLKKT
jgi:hypothetical protein